MFETPLYQMQRKEADTRRRERSKGSLDVDELLREARSDEN